MNTTSTYPRKNFGANKFQSDPANSTYRWEFHLTPGYPGNKVGVLDGYSCGQGVENPNKITLFTKKLENPILSYLSRSTEIVIYEQNHFLPKYLHKELLVLHHDNFYAKQEWVKQTPQIMDYLDRWYSIYRETGKMPAVEDRRKNARQPTYFQDLDHSKYTFQSLADLRVFCEAKAGTYSKTCMDQWFKVHAQFQPELFQTDDRDVMMHAIRTAPTAEKAQALISEMNRKFNINS